MRTTRRETRRDLAYGRTLEQHVDIATALTSGELRTEQARVIAEAVDALPSYVDVLTRDLAEMTPRWRRRRPAPLRVSSSP